MSVESKAQLKTYFENGDTPTEGQFINLIDSFAHTNDLIPPSDPNAAISVLTTPGGPPSETGNVTQNIVQKDSLDRWFLVGGVNGNRAPLGVDKLQFISGILRPYDDGTGLASEWRFIQDSAHYGEYYLDSTIQIVTTANAEALKLTFPQIDKIHTGFAHNDGDLGITLAGLSINTTSVTIPLYRLREPYLSVLIRKAAGNWSVNSWYETPTGNTDFDTLTFTESGNELTIDFADHTYFGYPMVRPSYDGTLFHTMIEYPGSGSNPTQAKIRFFDSSGAAMTSIPNLTEIFFERRVSAQPIYERLNPADPSFFQDYSLGNIWFGMWAQLNDY